MDFWFDLNSSQMNNNIQSVISPPVMIAMMIMKHLFVRNPNVADQIFNIFLFISYFSINFYQIESSFHSVRDSLCKRASKWAWSHCDWVFVMAGPPLFALICRLFLKYDLVLALLITPTLNMSLIRILF